MLKDNLSKLKDAARFNFMATGSLMPVFISDMSGGFTIMPLFWQNAEDKENFSNQLKTWITNGHVKEYVIIAESWVLKSSEKDPISSASDWISEHGSLQFHPERTEAIMIQYCSPTEEIDIFAEIKRDGDDFQLGDWQTNSREIKVSKIDPTLSSRFNDLFAKGSSSLN